jgi:putative DNA primase/helicase
MTHADQIAAAEAHVAELRRKLEAITSPPIVPVDSPTRGVSMLSGSGSVPGPQTVLAPPEYGETEIADRFVQNCCSQISYVRTRGQWNYWNGKKWCVDQTGYVHDFARRHCQAEAAICSGTPGYTSAQVRALCSDKTVNAILRLASIDQRIAMKADDWDQDEWLLGTPDGVVELRTGTLREARPEDRVTKSTSVAPAGDCPRFLSFLSRATNGNKQLEYYLQRLCGYFLTGSTREQMLPFAHGPGRTGKGTFMHAVHGILADYHVATAIETITESKQDRHPAEVAALQGARLVTCSETEKGRHWAESRIKQWTGDDPIPARFMNGNWFNFVPTFKLMVSGNYKPSLRPDSAMRRRVQLIPFNTPIPEAETDPQLGNKLRDEWPGILGWMIAGCLAWQRDGLQPPAVVLDATRAYMDDESEDVLTMWIADRCTVDPKAESFHSPLYDSFKRYAELAGEKPTTSAQFGKELKRLEFGARRTNSNRWVVGLKLNDPPPLPPPR